MQTETTPTGRTTDLYRNDEGHEVWIIREADGTIVAEDVESDHDAEWILHHA